MFSSDYTNATLAGERRWGFATFNLVLLWLGAVLMAPHIFQNGLTTGGVILFALFLVLLAQAVYGFTLAVTGWWLLWHGGDPVHINKTLPRHVVPGKLPATAIVMPIFNEDVGRVFQGVRVMYESLQTTGQGDAFDFFILSDSSDLNNWIAEEKAWFELCKQVQGFGRIFYRKRRLAQHHKSGNIADFCRRWGKKYRHMIVLDADSVMTGATFVRLAGLMKQNPQAGIIQTCPQLALGRSLFQRINQFACSAYSPLFVAGSNFWQMNNANFYGHNAIVRLQPFMQFCAMPELPPSGSLGRRILSHDTVEAAFMRRAGYDVWLAYGLGGSYEESPPHLLASLQRDRRWCHGNLQHLWFLFAPRLTVSSRINILIGIMAYVSSPLWLLFLLLSPMLFIGGNLSAGTGLLFVYVMGLLLVPKVLGTMLLLSRSEQLKTFGSRGRVLISVIGEMIFSMILAPILMLFYTQFVWSSFFGGGVGWGRQKRADDTGPSWQECITAHLGHTLLAVAVGALVAWLVPAMLPWLLFVLTGLIVAIPFSRLLASNNLGWISRRKKWFLIPEETRPPWELQQMLKPFAPTSNSLFLAKDYAADIGLLQTVLDPYFNAIHVSLLHERPHAPLRTHEYMTALSDRLLFDGPFALTHAEKKLLLWDANTMLALHQKLWCSPASNWHAWWQVAFRIYNESNKRDSPGPVHSF